MTEEVQKSMINTTSGTLQPQSSPNVTYSLDTSYFWKPESIYLTVFYLSQVSFTTICYLVILSCIIWTPQFHTPGYFLLLSLMSAETFSSVAWHFLGTLPVTLHYYGLLTYEFPFALNAAFLHSVLYYIAAFHMLIISGQRYCAIAYLETYHRWFTKKTTAVIIILLWIAGFTVALPCYIGPCQLFFSVEYFSVAYNYEHPVTASWLFIDNIHSIISTVIMIMFWTLFLYKLRKIHKTSSLNKSAPVRSQISVVKSQNTIPIQQSSNVGRHLGSVAVASCSSTNIPVGDPGQKVGSVVAGSAMGGAGRASEERRLSIQIAVIGMVWCGAAVEWVVLNKVMSSGLTLPDTAVKLVWTCHSVLMIWQYGIDPVVMLIMNRALRRTARQGLCTALRCKL